MADIGVQHVWTTPGGTITFNSGLTDQYYLNVIPGLDGVNARVPTDQRPYGHGGYIHTGWKDLRRFQPEGSLLILSTFVMDEIVEIRNDMEAALIAAYDSLLDADGTWVWTPQGESQRTLTVRRDEQPMAFVHVDNYQVVDFSFGLVCAEPDWT